VTISQTDDNCWAKPLTVLPPAWYCGVGNNLLYYGDNPDVLKRHIKDESVDLAYLDPPFNSNATYLDLPGGRGCRGQDVPGDANLLIVAEV